MSDAVVLIEMRDTTAWVTINRPGKLNALSSEVVIELTKTIKELEADERVRVIVLAGAGKNFSVGYDIAEEVQAGLARPEDWHEALTRNVGLSMAVWSVTKPTIAAVDGWCLAGACEVAMACDMIIATDRAQFGEPEIRFGSGPVTLLMPFLIGQKKTNELLLTGDLVTASEAERIGMINKVTTPEELESVVENLAKRISITPPITLKLTKIALTRAYEAMGLRNAVNANLDLAATLNAAYSEEKTEFAEKVKNEGLRSALNWRDERYGKLQADTPKKPAN